MNIHKQLDGPLGLAQPEAQNVAVAVVPPVAGFGPKIKAVFIHKQLERKRVVRGARVLRTTGQRG